MEHAETLAHSVALRMAHIRTSARAIIRKDTSLLVVRYQDTQVHWYCLPGGGQRHGEDLASSLVREVAEETGLQIRVGPLHFVRECLAGPQSRALPPDFHQVELFFACEIIAPHDGPLEQDQGQDGFEWCSLHELRSRCFFPDALLDAIESGREFGYLGVS